jgi:two-component system response regulator AtoC
MPLDMQAKLLRVLQERTYERVGDGKPQRLAARIITATHRDLETMVAEGSFREDLSYRLRVVEITVPPLRDRKEDIPGLVAHLLAKITRDLHTAPKSLSTAAMDKLVAYPWPGNVRELENALTRACVMAKAEVLGPEHFPFLHEATPESKEHPTSPNGAPAAAAAAAVDWTTPPTLRDVEREHVTRVLLHTGWNKRRTCSLLAITRPTLDRKIKEYGLVRPVKN